MATTDSKIEDFAEELGKLLGNARAKADSWLGQRQQITKTLQGIRDEATHLLSQLGHQAEAAVAKRRGRPAGRKTLVAKRGPGRPPKVVAEAADAAPKKKRTMSAKARAAISRAQKARWAKQKAAR